MKVPYVKNQKLLNRLATTIAIAGMIVGTMANLAGAAPLKNGESIDGFIQGTSPTYKFKNQARSGAPGQSARGEEFTFAAQKGNSITLSIDVEDGSALKPILVLLSPQGTQVAYDESKGFLRYRVPTTGTYRLLVLGANNTRGRYTVALAGAAGNTASTGTGTQQGSQADQVMRDVLRLNIIGCGVPNVAKIKIGNEERCTRDIEAGSYTYDAASASIKPVDNRRELIAQKLQVTVLERCPAAGTPTVQILVREPQDGKDYTYCANPTRYVKAGTYRYDIGSDDLRAVDATTAQPSTGTQTGSTGTTAANDQRRQLLQNDYGLRVLDGCPAARTNLVVVSFPDQQANQNYVYCANPNRLVTAGEYTYNAKTGNLDAAKKPAPACTVSIGGVCIVK